MQENSLRDYAATTVQASASAGEWMTLQAASNATGLSMATLRRYLKRKTLKGRRLGKTSNAKVEVFITPDFHTSDQDRVSTEGLEDILAAEIDEEFEDDETSDQSTRDTMGWLRDKLDDKDEKIEELSKKVELLNEQLTAASYRNGYLESQQQNYQEQIKLLTMNPTENSGRLGKFFHWFTGKTK